MEIDKNLKLQNEGCYSELLNEEDQKILKQIITNYEFDVNSACHTGFQNDYTHNSNYNDLSKLKYQAIENKVWQFWFFKASPIIGDDNFNFIKLIGKKILNKLYPNDIIEKYSDINQINFTLFDYDCFIKNHQDGYSKNALCNILFYLNKDYKDGFGGELVINNEHIIKPEFGRIGVIDFYYSNPEHKVNKILSTKFHRKAFLASIPIKVVN